MRSEAVIKYTYWMLAAFFVASTIIGGMRQFSPVPFFDTWDGAIEFYLKFEKTHDWHLWWAQHNEHRIVLAKALFWIDLKFFGGTGLFLIFTNYIFLGLIVVLFCKILIETKISNLQYLLPFSVAWLVFWIQNQNLTWGFQVQFWMAQLFPLLAFYSYYKSLKGNNAGYFLVSLFCTVLATVSMANGILTAPLILIYSVYSRSNWYKYIVLAVVSVIELILYFSGYRTPSFHGNLLTAIHDNPFGLIHYILLYLGSPFVNILGSTGFAKSIGALLGIIFIILTAGIVLHKIKSRIRGKVEISINDVLICYILYMLVTAIGTAGGRILFGVEQSLSSRYTTPALMGWLAIFIIIYPKILLSIELRWVNYGLLSLVSIMLPVQVKALSLSNTVKTERKVAALAIAMDVHDKSQLNNLWTSMDDLLRIGRDAKLDGITIFSEKPLSQMENKINTRAVLNYQGTCKGYLDTKETISTDGKWIKITGWFHSRNLPQYVWIVDKDSIVSGAAVLTVSRNNISKKLGVAGKNMGLSGYVLSRQVNNIAYLISNSDDCTVKVEYIKR